MAKDKNESSKGQPKAASGNVESVIAAAASSSTLNDSKRGSSLLPFVKNKKYHQKKEDLAILINRYRGTQDELRKLNESYKELETKKNELQRAVVDRDQQLSKMQSDLEEAETEIVRIGEENRINSVDDFFRCTQEGDIAKVALALSSPGSELYANAKDSEGRTSLLLASKVGNSDILRMLLEQNADATVLDSEGNSALHLAASVGSKDCIRQLVKQGLDVDAKNGKGETPVKLLDRYMDEGRRWLAAEGISDYIEKSSVLVGRVVEAEQAKLKLKAEAMEWEEKFRNGPTVVHDDEAERREKEHIAEISRLKEENGHIREELRALQDRYNDMKDWFSRRLPRQNERLEAEVDSLRRENQHLQTVISRKHVIGTELRGQEENLLSKKEDIDNAHRDFMATFFDLTVAAVRKNHPEHTIPLDTPELYAEAVRDEVPFHKWSDWILARSLPPRDKRERDMDRRRELDEAKATLEGDYAQSVRNRTPSPAHSRPRSPQFTGRTTPQLGASRALGSLRDRSPSPALSSRPLSPGGRYGMPAPASEARRMDLGPRFSPAVSQSGPINTSRASMPARGYSPNPAAGSQARAYTPNVSGIFPRGNSPAVSNGILREATAGWT